MLMVLNWERMRGDKKVSPSVAMTALLLVLATVLLMALQLANLLALNSESMSGETMVYSMVTKLAATKECLKELQLASYSGLWKACLKE